MERRKVCQTRVKKIGSTWYLHVRLESSTRWTREGFYRTRKAADRAAIKANYYGIDAARV